MSWGLHLALVPVFPSSSFLPVMRITSKSSEVHPSPADSVSSCSLLMKGAHHLAAVPQADRLLSAGVPAQSKPGLESCHPLRPFASRLRGVVKTRH